MTVQVAADRRTVWERWSDIARWPEWNPTCSDGQISGALAPGARLRLQLIHPRGRTFLTAPTVMRVEPDSLFAWETRALGVRAPTIVTFTDADDGTNVALTSESRGILGFAYRLTFPETAQGLLWSGALTGLAQSFRVDDSAGDETAGTL